MRDIVAGITIVAGGILVAVAILAAGWLIVRPAQTVTIKLSEYICATDGKTVQCQRV